MTPPPPSAIDNTEAVTDTSAVTIPDPLQVPLKINDIHGRRRKAEKAQWGVAAPASSERFKGDTRADKPRAKRWDRESTLPQRLPAHAGDMSLEGQECVANRAPWRSQTA